MVLTKYTMADILSKHGIKSTLKPFEDAVDGSYVIMLSSSRITAALSQRGYYQRLLKSKTPVCSIRAGKITFASKGVMVFISPDIDLNKFRGLDPKSTFFCLTPE